MDDYDVKEFQDREPSYQVTVPLKYEKSDQLELVRALIKSGAVRKLGDIEFLVINDEIKIVLWVKSPTRFQIEPKLNDARALLDLAIQKYLEIEPFFLALEVMKSQGKRR